MVTKSNEGHQRGMEIVSTLIVVIITRSVLGITANKLKIHLYLLGRAKVHNQGASGVVKGSGGGVR